MDRAHNAISSSYASLTWVLNPVVEGVRVLSLLSISSQRDADFHLELTGYFRLFHMAFETYCLVFIVHNISHLCYLRL